MVPSAKPWVHVGETDAEDAAAGTQVGPMLLYPCAVQGPLLSPSIRCPNVMGSVSCGLMFVFLATLFVSLW